MQIVNVDVTKNVKFSIEKVKSIAEIIDSRYITGKSTGTAQVTLVGCSACRSTSSLKIEITVDPVQVMLLSSRVISGMNLNGYFPSEQFDDKQISKLTVTVFQVTGLQDSIPPKVQG